MYDQDSKVGARQSEGKNVHCMNASYREDYPKGWLPSDMVAPTCHLATVGVCVAVCIWRNTPRDTGTLKDILFALALSRTLGVRAAPQGFSFHLYLQR